MKVICTLNHASETINGIRFDKHALGRISEDISQEHAEALLSIPGYVEEFKVKGGKNIDAAKLQAASPVQALVTEQAAKQDNFRSSFDDGQQSMATTLLDATPGWEKMEPAGTADADNAKAAEKSADKKK